MIDLGLARSYALLNALGTPQNYFKAFHVAGTNGKGSVVSYLSSIFVANGITTGKFTSPHLLTENDCICINDVPIALEKYHEVGAYVRQIDQRHQIGATEFETQTAIAFEVFRRHSVKYAVVEVGLGGLLDATNVLTPCQVLCTGITKISLDHEQFLGTDLATIAKQKAGIVKFGVPCIVDSTNQPKAIEVVAAVAKDQSASLSKVEALPPSVAAYVKSGDLLLGSFQEQNAAVAATMALQAGISPEVIAEGLRRTRWRGRLEWITFKDKRILVDGAHNAGAATELAKFAHSTFEGSITWVVAFSKPCDTILPLLVRPQDKVVCTTFGAVDGMPWIKAQSAEQVAEVARTVCGNVEVVANVTEGLESRENVVVCGSLYLLKDILAA